ncbi:MAG: dihydropteroate synthase [Ignavibacteria bacterium CG22_combo_CG10-13_8_21_14_all_37_15]|nr:MAG: dihydropteroate synthase [Ignavibacteria bacterium CG22_combo_CG10-13_8_21_14_all_37_15]
MGIVNVTPDSFSDGGKYFDSRKAVQHGLLLDSQGADIIDIGGESTRPGSGFISVEEELSRTIPIIKILLKKKKGLLISIDTTKSEVAEEALKAGAVIVNDISGGTFDDRMFKIAGAFDAGFIIMHMKGNPKTMQHTPSYKNLTKEIYSFLEKQVIAAKICKVKKIIIDPGIGFGKTVKHNFEIINHLSDFMRLGYPVLIGLSRKSFLGKTLKLGTTNRDIPTAIMEAVAFTKGASLIRTHNMEFGLLTKKLITALR